MKYLGTLLACLVMNGIFSQTIQVVESSTNTAIPFVKVYPSVGNPFLADIDGFFDAKSAGDEFTLRMSGYADSTFIFSGQKVIVLRALENELEEVIINPGNNPAERIMELAIQNRKRNHPKSDASFQFTSYSKFIFTLNPDALAAISDTTTDSTLMEIKSYFDQQHLFLLESTTEHFFSPPFREKEVITAYKVSGFKDPMFSSFANDLQTFNFYENQFNVFGTAYINPLAFGGVRRYLFILEDSTVNAPGDTTFTIQFRPRLGSNFEGMKGTLYINSRGYAVEKVIAEPATKNADIQPRIIQEYECVDGKKWFPMKLSTEANFPGMSLSKKLENGYIIGKGTTYIEQVQLGVDLSKEHFNAAIVQTEIDAADKDSIHWQSSRTYALSAKEKLTYQTVDSISIANKLNAKLGLLSSVLEGKLPIGYAQLDLSRLLDYRDYEGYRIGLGIENSSKLFKRITVGGYCGYGTRDKAWKYGGYANFLVFPKQFGTLSVRFQDDIIERGGTSFLAQEKTLSLTNYSSHLYVQNMDRQRLAEATFAIYLTARMKILGGFNYQRVRFTDDYQFLPMVQSGVNSTSLEVAESMLEYQWSIGEKVLFLGAKRVSLGSKWPMLRMKVIHAIPHVFKSDLTYWRAMVSIQQLVAMRGVGKLQWELAGHATTGHVPLVWQNRVNGTGGNWNLSVPNSFETVLPSRFYNQQQVALFTRFIFKPFLSKLKWTAPQIGLHHAIGWGRLDAKSDHSGSFQSMDKGYLEGGVFIQNLIISGKTGIGIGVFCPYGYYGSTHLKDVVTFKIALGFAM
jgi:hypothetical protein